MTILITNVCREVFLMSVHVVFKGGNHLPSQEFSFPQRTGVVDISMDGTFIGIISVWFIAVLIDVFGLNCDFIEQVIIFIYPSTFGLFIRDYEQWKDRSVVRINTYDFLQHSGKGKHLTNSGLRCDKIAFMAYFSLKNHSPLACRFFWRCITVSNLFFFRKRWSFWFGK